MTHLDEREKREACNRGKCVGGERKRKSTWEREGLTGSEERER